MAGWGGKRGRFFGLMADGEVFRRIFFFFFFF